MISIVDDDTSAREGITDLLRSVGYSAQAFGRPDDFLRSARIDDTDCLITDMRMPGMTGLELHTRLIAAGKRIPTIVITAYPQEPDRLRAESAGVLGYLAKPCDEERLFACIRSALDGKRDHGRSS